MIIDWRFQSVRRLKRGFNGGSGKLGSYGRSEEDDSLSRESLNGCSGEINKRFENNYAISSCVTTV